MARRPSAYYAAPRAPRVVLSGALAVTMLLLVIATLRYVPGSPLSAAAGPRWLAVTATPSSDDQPQTGPTKQPLAVAAHTVTLNTVGSAEWTMIDRRANKAYGSLHRSAVGNTASLIKVWIAADFLRRNDRISDTRRSEVSHMIRDSDNDAATDLFDVNGGIASINRMISICGLTDSSGHPNWSETKMSARDIARLGTCIATGRAAGPTWTAWLYNEMQQVRGEGDFGIRKAFPPALARTIAIKNGWLLRDETGDWEINCLAIGNDWTVGVMARYPGRLGQAYGENICRSVGTQLRA